MTEEELQMNETSETINENNDSEQTETNNPVSELDELKKQVSEANDKFLRLYAEFDNYKRRTIKERAELLQTAGKEVILSFLPIIDDFERALKAADEKADLNAYKEGISLIHNKFINTLSAKGLTPLESIGKEFNVDLHEAITKIPAPTEDLKGKVIDETEKGYTLNGHVVRFAKVIIGE
ncbi:MAG: nucleotide exchange factor GrpE [Bacteroidota bacterium]|nr:nucleotide exchange factor GrpE [Bacteroidota bacterium]